MRDSVAILVKSASLYIRSLVIVMPSLVTVSFANSLLKDSFADSKSSVPISFPVAFL